MIARDRQTVVLAGLMAKLGADGALAALVAHRIYDATPGKLVTPALSLRLVGGLDASSADSDAQRLTFDVDVWDRYALGTDLSRPRVLMDHVRRILHLQPLTLVDTNLILLRCTGSQGPMRDPDGLTLHGVVSLQALAGHESAG